MGGKKQNKNTNPQVPQNVQDFFNNLLSMSQADQKEFLQQLFGRYYQQGSNINQVSPQQQPQYNPNAYMMNWMNMMQAANNQLPPNPSSQSLMQQVNFNANENDQQYYQSLNNPPQYPAIGLQQMVDHVQQQLQAYNAADQQMNAAPVKQHQRNDSGKKSKSINKDASSVANDPANAIQTLLTQYQQKKSSGPMQQNVQPVQNESSHELSNVVAEQQNEDSNYADLEENDRCIKIFDDIMKSWVDKHMKGLGIKDSDFEARKADFEQPIRRCCFQKVCGKNGFVIKIRHLKYEKLEKVNGAGAGAGAGAEKKYYIDKLMLILDCLFELGYIAIEYKEATIFCDVDKLKSAIKEYCFDHPSNNPADGIMIREYMDSNNISPQEAEQVKKLASASAQVYSKYLSSEFSQLSSSKPQSSRRYSRTDEQSIWDQMKGQAKPSMIKDKQRMIANENMISNYDKIRLIFQNALQMNTSVDFQNWDGQVYSQFEKLYCSYPGKLCINEKSVPVINFQRIANELTRYNERVSHQEEYTTILQLVFIHNEIMGFKMILNYRFAFLVFAIASRRFRALEHDLNNPTSESLNLERFRGSLFDNAFQGYHFKKITEIDKEKLNSSKSFCLYQFIADHIANNFTNQNKPQGYVVQLFFEQKEANKSNPKLTHEMQSFVIKQNPVCETSLKAIAIGKKPFELLTLQQYQEKNPNQKDVSPLAVLNPVLSSTIYKDAFVNCVIYAAELSADTDDEENKLFSCWQAIRILFEQFDGILPPKGGLTDLRIQKVLEHIATMNEYAGFLLTNEQYKEIFDWRDKRSKLQSEDLKNKDSEIFQYSENTATTDDSYGKEQQHSAQGQFLSSQSPYASNQLLNSYPINQIVQQRFDFQHPPQPQPQPQQQFQSGLFNTSTFTLGNSSSNMRSLSKQMNQQFNQSSKNPYISQTNSSYGNLNFQSPYNYRLPQPPPQPQPHMINDMIQNQQEQSSNSPDVYLDDFEDTNGKVDFRGFVTNLLQKSQNPQCRSLSMPNYDDIDDQVERIGAFIQELEALVETKYAELQKKKRDSRKRHKLEVFTRYVNYLICALYGKDIQLDEKKWGRAFEFLEAFSLNFSFEEQKQICAGKLTDYSTDGSQFVSELMDLYKELWKCYVAPKENQVKSEKLKEQKKAQRKEKEGKTKEETKLNVKEKKELFKLFLDGKKWLKAVRQVWRVPIKARLNHLSSPDKGQKPGDRRDVISFRTIDIIKLQENFLFIYETYERFLDQYVKNPKRVGEQDLTSIQDDDFANGNGAHQPISTSVQNPIGAAAPSNENLIQPQPVLANNANDMMIQTVSRKYYFVKLSGKMLFEMSKKENFILCLTEGPAGAENLAMCDEKMKSLQKESCGEEEYAMLPQMAYLTDEEVHDEKAANDQLDFVPISEEIQQLFGPLLPVAEDEDADPILMIEYDRTTKNQEKVTLRKRDAKYQAKSLKKVDKLEKENANVANEKEDAKKNGDGNEDAQKKDNENDDVAANANDGKNDEAKTD